MPMPIFCTARRASSSLLNAPNTHEPEPVIWAKAAPFSYSRWICVCTSGSCRMAGASSEFPASARHAAKSCLRSASASAGISRPKGARPMESYAPKIPAVERPSEGIISTSGMRGAPRICSIRSPIPCTCANLPSMQNGTSAPSFAASFISDFAFRFIPHSRLSAISATAQSALPPPKPARTGIRFTISMRAPLFVPAYSLSAFAALSTRFLPAAGRVRTPPGCWRSSSRWLTA